MVGRRKSRWAEEPTEHLSLLLKRELSKTGAAAPNANALEAASSTSSSSSSLDSSILSVLRRRPFVGCCNGSAAFGFYRFNGSTYFSFYHSHASPFI